MQKDVQRVQPLYDADEAGDLLPTEIDGAMRADAVIAEANARRRENPEIAATEELEALQLPGPKPHGIQVKLDSGERQIVIEFNGRHIGFIKWAASQGQYLVQRRVMIDGRFTSENPVRYFCGLAGAWRVCCEYGISIEEFQRAFRDLPPAVQWSFEKCPVPEKRQQMACKLFYWNPDGDPRSTAAPDIKCRTCQAVFAMDDKGNLTLKEGPAAAGERRSVAAAGQTTEAPVAARPSIPFEREFLRYQGGTKARLAQLQDAGADSWAGIAERGLPWLVSIGWKEELAEQMLEIAREHTP